MFIISIISPTLEFPTIVQKALKIKMIKSFPGSTREINQWELGQVQVLVAAQLVPQARNTERWWSGFSQSSTNCFNSGRRLMTPLDELSHHSSMSAFLSSLLSLTSSSSSYLSISLFLSHAQLTSSPFSDHSS